MKTKEKIIKESAALFNTRGYDGCSMQDIMLATGLQKGGIYNYFKSKDEIAASAFDYNLDKVISAFKEKLADKNTSSEKILSVIDVLSGLADGTTLKGGCPVFNTAVYAGNRDFLKHKAREGVEMLKDYIKIKIQQGIDCGEFISDADGEKISVMIIMTLEGGVIMSRIYEDKTHIEIAAEYIKHYLKKYLFKAHYGL